MDRDTVAVEFKCPVCQILASPQPVLAEDGFIYHKQCIEKFIDGRTNIKSPMTPSSCPFGSILIASKIIESTLLSLEKCECLKSDNELDQQIENTVLKAKMGDPRHMAILGRWHLFGEKEPWVKRDAKAGFDLVKQAHNKNDLEASAYFGHCLIRGLQVEQDKNEGFEILVDVTSSSEGSVDGRDFAASTLGFCYREGLYGFKLDTKRAAKWLSKVVNKPDESKIWGDVYEDVKRKDFEQSVVQSKAKPADDDADDYCKKQLFDDNKSLSTWPTTDSSYFSGLTENTTKTCDVCEGVFESKDMFNTMCKCCFDEDLSRKISTSFFLD